MIIIVLTETWLNDSILDTELFEDRYSVFRCDRMSSGNCKGGGVLIAVSKKVRAHRLYSFESSCDDLWVQACLTSNSNRVIDNICAIYIPPPPCFSIMEKFVENCSRVILFTDKTKTLIAGDFNLGSMEWGPKLFK